MRKVSDDMPSVQFIRNQNFTYIYNTHTYTLNHLTLHPERHIKYSCHHVGHFCQINMDKMIGILMYMCKS